MSVIVPVHNAHQTLDGCLKALLASQGIQMEVIVVDDASTDGSRELAAPHAVQRLELPCRSGAGAARNYGAEHARAPILVFVDSDVLVAPDTVSRLHEALEGHPEWAAVIGSYGPSCPHGDFFSQYKNLHHHYIHQTSRQQAATFWTGCGAIQRETFEAMGGFPYQDAVGPDLGDMELGYRLRRAGYRIALLPHIQVTHDKRYTFWSLVRSDVVQRAIPWTRIMWRNRVFRSDLNTRIAHVASAALLFTALLGLLAPLSWITKTGGGLAVLAAVTALNWPWLTFCGRQRGWRFASGAMAMEWVYYLYSGVGALLGTALYLGEGLWRDREAPEQWDRHAEAAFHDYYLPPPLASHKGEVLVGLIRLWWGKRGQARRLLKTDLYEEAFGQDQILLRPPEPWHSRRMVGIDLSLTVLQRAKARALSSERDGLQVVCADVRRLPFRDGSFDLVLSISTLDHFQGMADLEGAVGEIDRSVSPGGCLFLTMDNPRNPWISLRGIRILQRTFGPLGLLRVPLGRTVPWERVGEILDARGWHRQGPRFLLHYPRALFIGLLRRSFVDPETGAIRRFLRLSENWGRRWWGRYTGLYYALWCRKPKDTGKPSALSDLQLPPGLRRAPKERRPQRVRELIDEAGRWGHLRDLWPSSPSRFPLPVHVQIQTLSRCNGRCIHCPYPTTSRQHGEMPWELFQGIIGEILSWPHPERRVVHLMLQNEPILDPRLAQAVRLVKAHRPAPRVALVTNGTLLTPSVIAELGSAGLDELVVSVDAATRAVYQRVHPGLSFSKLLRGLTALAHADPVPFHWSLSYLRHRHTIEDLDPFLAFCRARGISHRVFSPVNRAGTLDAFAEIALARTPREKRVALRRRLLWGVCRLPMATCCILYNGDMILCCHDWKPFLVLGNVQRESLQEIWQGEAFGEIRRNLACGQLPPHTPCEQCSLSAFARRSLAVGV